MNNITTDAACLDSALAYHASGLAITICREKVPVGKAWQHRQWTESEIEAEYRRNPGHNVGAILGPRSNLIDMECDEPGAEDDYKRLFEGCEIAIPPMFISRRGKHRVFGWDDRLDAVAKLPGCDSPGKGAVVHFGALEVRLGATGKGAQSLLPPSETGGVTRRWVPGLSLAECDPPQLPGEVINRIVAAAVEQFKPDEVPESNGATVSGGRPGDEFNRHGSWDAVFADTDWAVDHVDGDVVYWRRPGKAKGEGWSASTGFCHREGVGDLLYVFSSNATPFKQEHAYSKFTAYTLLHHPGDFKGAAKALAAKGFGGQQSEDNARSPQSPPGRAADSQKKSTESKPKPEIYAGMADLEKTTKLAWEALIAANDPPILFRHGSVPSRIERDDDDYPVAKPITQDRMKFHLAASAKWFKLVGKELENKACSPPKDVVANVMATPNMPLPILTRIVEAPVYAADGTLQTKPGYHAQSKTYYEPAKGFLVPIVPARPTQQQIADARELLLDDLLGDFPFVEAAEWAHSLAVLLHPFCRELIDGPTPLHLVEKPEPGTGATLLVDMLAWPSLGHNLAGMTEGRDEDEWRKRITAKLRRAEAFFLIDNLGVRLQSPAIASAITTPRWEDRLLGVSEMASISVRCCWLATGNNPAVSNEIARRTVRIRLDAKVDRPWMREGFRHPELRVWAKDNRSRLVGAALTLIRAWLVEGRPAGKAKPIGMFESWSAVVGGILDVAGVDGFLGNLIDFYDTADEEGKLWRAFVTDWWNTWGDRAITIKDLMGVVKEGATFDLGDKSEQSQRIRLGKKVGSHRDRVYEIEVGDEPNTHPIKVQVQRAGEKKRATLWKLGKLG